MKIDGLSQLLEREEVQKKLLDVIGQHTPKSVIVKSVEIGDDGILILVKHKGLIFDTTHELLINQIALAGNGLQIKIGRVGGFFLNLVAKTLMGIFKSNYSFSSDIMRIDLSERMDDLGLLVAGGLNFAIEGKGLVVGNEVQ